jgi:hypothetical protein
MVAGDAARAMADAKVVENGVTLLMPQVRQFAKMVKDESTGDYTVRIVDGEGTPRMNGQGGLMTVADLVKEFKTTFPMAFQSDGKGGSGHQDSGTKKTVQQKTGEKSSIDKISAGLASGGLVRARG